MVKIDISSDHRKNLQGTLARLRSTRINPTVGPDYISTVSVPTGPETVADVASPHDSEMLMPSSHSVNRRRKQKRKDNKF